MNYSRKDYSVNTWRVKGSTLYCYKHKKSGVKKYVAYTTSGRCIELSLQRFVEGLEVFYNSNVPQHILAKVS